ncbi:hypothetical protein [Streptomyces sp. N35]|uniref:hypothetical protein n=1 Tax=Streptomyces sp. N35 TaxID=2795730 RepID=UPI0018F6ABBD|nr:hypothetical protein [Streptomyces sp. N35]
MVVEHPRSVLTGTAGIPKALRGVRNPDPTAAPSPAASWSAAATDIGDRAAAQVLLWHVADAPPTETGVRADGGWADSLTEFCLAALALVLLIVKRSDNMRGLVVLPKWRTGEGFCADLMESRRQARDFERHTTAKTMMYWSMTTFVTRGLGRSRPG